MAKSKLPEKHKLEAYNQRDVTSLPPPFTKWSPELEAVQKTHNRILQPGFMHRDTSKVLEDAKSAGVAWLTDVCSPSASAAIMLHISKEMVVNYQVGDTELNIKAHAVYASLVKGSSTLAAIEQEVNSKIAKFSENKGEIEKSAREMLSKNYGADKDITGEQLEAAKRLVVDIERRKIMYPIVSKMIKEHLNEKAESLGLAKKTLHPIGETHDFFYGGPAGSGKSTLSGKDLSDGPDPGPEPKKTNKRDCVTVATDIYRAFTLPGTEAHEAIVTKDIFTRTQDFAYLVKEQVLNEMTEGMKVDNKRPNLINDGVTVEWAVRGMLAQTKPENLVSKVALYRGDPGFVGIAERADDRAKKLDADPADKGRFIETTSLFKGHADASQSFLANVPANAVTEVFDTNIDRDKKEEPVKVAKINSGNHTLEILNLRVVSEWLNKRNINIAAEHPVELILKKQEKSVQSPVLVTDPANKAAAILELVKGNPYEKPPASYEVILKNKEGIAYASLVSDGDKNVKLRVLDLEVFKTQVNRDASPEAEVLRAITRQTAAATAAIQNSPEASALLEVTTKDANIALAQDIREKETKDSALDSAVKRQPKVDAHFAQEEPAPIQPAPVEPTPLMPVATQTVPVGAEQRKILSDMRRQEQEQDNTLSIPGPGGSKKSGD